jgi:hypothetical protein
MNPPSRKNVESADAQAERERQAFEKRAAIYNKHAMKHYHHHRVRYQQRVYNFVSQRHAEVDVFGLRVVYKHACALFGWAFVQ